MSKKKIIFRADGNAKIGYGHVMRSLALADMLKENFECQFATRFVSNSMEKEILNCCSKIILLNEDDKQHYQEFIEIIETDDIIVLDNYFFTSDYQKEIKDKGCKLVCIDDMHDKHYLADVILNHAPHVKVSDFSYESYTKLYLGLEYALLRNPFLINENKKPISELNHTLICFGGSDFNNLTQTTLSSLSGCRELRKISIVIGNGYQFKDLLIDYIDNLKNVIEISLYININADALVKIIREVDIAIVSCSTILIEVISQGTLAIAGYYVDNQKEFANGLVDKYNEILIVGNLNEKKVTCSHIFDSIKRINGKNLTFSLNVNKISNLYIDIFNGLK